MFTSSIDVSILGVRRDLVSQPKRPDVYLPVIPVAFGSQLNDEIDENERFVEISFNCNLA